MNTKTMCDLDRQLNVAKHTMYYLNDAENELHYHGYKRAVLVAVLAVGAAFSAAVAAAAVAAGPKKGYATT